MLGDSPVSAVRDDVVPSMFPRGGVRRQVHTKNKNSWRGQKYSLSYPCGDGTLFLKRKPIDSISGNTWP